MMKKQFSTISSIFIFLCLISSNYVQIAVTTNLENIQKDNSLLRKYNFMSSPEYKIELLDDGKEQEILQTPDSVSDSVNTETSSLKAQKPIFGDLDITIKNEENNFDPDSVVTKELIPEIPADKIKRGATVTVNGRLWGGISGRYWDGETVYLYYNVTKNQYKSNQAFYFGNSQYEVGSDVTNSSGIFSIDLVTSTLSSSPFSKVGQINLLAWFNGSSAERLAGSPGAKNVTFFGQMDINHIAVVTNPGQPYSFTTRILYDNGTTVQTFGTSYNLDIDWETSNTYDHSATHAFTIANQHIYSATAPGPSEETVYYSASYDITQLGIHFFVENGTNVLVSEDYVINTDNVPYATEQTLLVDAYYDFTGIYLKGPQEIQMGSTIDFYANLSSSAGLEAGRDIDIYIRYGTNTVYSHSNTTDGSGEITFSIYFDPSVYTDITRGISIIFRFYDSDFYPARFLNDTLTTILAIDIGSITLTLDNPSIFYTTSMSLGFNVEIRDVNNNLARASRFQLNFPGIGTEQIVTPTGSIDVTKIIPSYAIQNDFETIVVTALFEDGGTYKYYVPGSPSDSDIFNIYHSLTLTLYYPNATVVSTASTNEWNNTFWPTFSGGGYYNLTAVDQSGRNPIGVELKISFAGSTMNAYVTAGVNYVIWGYTSLQNASFESWEAFTGNLVATGGEMPSPPSITLSINVFGPDNTDPVISNVVLTPDPTLHVPHNPYYNITVTVTASDTGSGIRSVNITYYLLPPGTTTWIYGGVIVLTNTGPNTYDGTIIMYSYQAQYYVGFYVNATDYSRHGVNEHGTKQTYVPRYYIQEIGLGNSVGTGNYLYQVGDSEGPVEDSPPSFVGSSNPLNPSVDITVYINDSIIYSGMTEVRIYVSRNNTQTGDFILVYINTTMTNIPGTNQWTFSLDMDYNYEYWVYYVAKDSALPINNESTLFGPVHMQAIDSTGPTISSLTAIFNGTIATPETIVTYNATITDTQTNVSTVILSIDITIGETIYVDDYTVVMTRVGTSNVFSVQVDLSDFGLTRSGTYALLYSVTATDGVGNNGSASGSMGVLLEAGGLGFGNLGAIIGGAIGGIVVLLGGLFLWFNRHTIQTYAKKQTFKRRLRDYLREIIEDIKKDGLEGRYKDGLLKSWSVLEGIGREFFDLPRYKSQTPTEFGRLLAYRGKIESELINTLLYYFEKARYGFEEITEKDFNSGVRALLKLVDKIEVGEMKIES